MPRMKSVRNEVPVIVICFNVGVCGKINAVVGGISRCDCGRFGNDIAGQSCDWRGYQRQYYKNSTRCHAVVALQKYFLTNFITYNPNGSVCNTNIHDAFRVDI